MFVGHYGAALLGKRVGPRIPLGWLFAACQLPDLIWPVLVLLGIERVRVQPGVTQFNPLVFEYYPWSHSLLMVVVAATVLGLLLAMRSGDRRGAVVVGAVAVSHWVLDWLMHVPDLPLAPGVDVFVGLGAWRSTALTILLETSLVLAGVWSYATQTRALDRVGKWAWWSLVVFLLAAHAANSFGPPPSNARAVASGALLLWLLPFWAGWADRHRFTARSTPRTS